MPSYIYKDREASLASLAKVQNDKKANQNMVDRETTLLTF